MEREQRHIVNCPSIIHSQALAEEIEEKLAEAMADLRENEEAPTSHAAGGNEESREADGNVPSASELANQVMLQLVFKAYVYSFCKDAMFIFFTVSILNFRAAGRNGN